MLARRQAEKRRELAPAGEGPMSRTVAVIAEAVIGPMPGIVISRLAVSSPLTCSSICWSIACDLRVDRVDLRAQRPQRLANAVGNHNLAVLVGAGPSAGASGHRRFARPCGAMTPISARWPRNAFNKRRALAEKHLAHAVAHQLGLVLDRAQRHKPLTGPPAASLIAAASTLSFLFRRT